MTRFVFSINSLWQKNDFEEMIKNDICDYRLNAIRLKNQDIIRSVAHIRNLSDKYKSSTKIFFDTPGTKARLWYQDGNKIKISVNSKFFINLVTVPSKNTDIQLTGDELYIGASIGDVFRIHRSGYHSMSFQVIDKDNSRIHALALTDIIIGWGYHVINIDNYKMIDRISNADKSYLKNIDTIKPDIIGLSFADNPQIVKDMRDRFSNTDIKIFAKIETMVAVQGIGELVKTADGIIIGRDDLLSWYSQDEIDRFVLQISELCKKNKVPVIPASNYFSSLGHGKPMEDKEMDILRSVVLLKPEFIYVNETSKTSNWNAFYTVINQFI